MNANTGSARYRIGLDMSILDRTQTGTSVYADNLLRALVRNAPATMEIISVRSPRPLSSRNILARAYNLALEIAWLLLLLPLQVRRKKIDLMHMPANAISPFARIPQVCTIHDAHFITNPAGRDPIWKLYARLTFSYAARHADRIICDTSMARDDVVSLLHADRSRTEVINLGITERQADATDIEKASRYQPYILAVGATAPNKNIETLLNAFIRLRRDNLDDGYKLIVAGPADRSHAALETLVAEERVTGSVLLLGRVTDSMLAALYSHASIFAFPSLSEGFGLPPLEAMHNHVPVTASNAPCIPETLGDAPLYFDPLDVQGLYDNLRRMIPDPALKEKLVSAGDRQAARYSWDRTALETIKVYESLLGS